MVGFFVGELDVPVGIVRLLDPRVYFGAIQQPAQLVELCYIDEFPLNEFLVLVVETVLFLLADDHGFVECLLFVVGYDETELFVKLRCMLPFSADDPENDFAEIPVHSFWFYSIILQFDSSEDRSALQDQYLVRIGDRRLLSLVLIAGK